MPNVRETHVRSVGMPPVDLPFAMARSNLTAFGSGITVFTGLPTKTVKTDYISVFFRGFKDRSPCQHAHPYLFTNSQQPQPPPPPPPRVQKRSRDFQSRHLRRLYRPHLPTTCTDDTHQQAAQRTTADLRFKPRPTTIHKQPTLRAARPASLVTS